MNMSSELFQMIDRVTQAGDERSAYMSLLNTLLSLFQMDQAVICEQLEDGDVRLVFGMDRSKRILQSMDGILLSKTLVKQALETMSPVVFRDIPDSVETVPYSISEYSLKNIVCVPISKNPSRFINLASKRDPLRRVSEEELTHLRVASQAADIALQHHARIQELKMGNERLRSVLESKSGAFVYSSALMNTVLADAERFAPFNVSIVIQGESGCGKEELAREIHRLSGRKGPFVAVNCANLTESLLESELFGYAKGAFTGATQSKKGLFQEADGGTFFLDEVAEIPLNLQAKLLRVLQERTIRPLGSVQDISIDVRILAASHQDLKEAVQKKKFRDDLYYRIQEMTLFMPPLRGRMEDIEVLAQYFLNHFSAEFKLPSRNMSPEALTKLLTHGWPGNVRELKNVCRTAVILGRESILQPQDIRLDAVPPASRSSEEKAEMTEGVMLNLPKVGEVSDLRLISNQFERDLINRMLGEPGETQASVAKRLNISIRTLQRIVSKESKSGDERDSHLSLL